MFLSRSENKLKSKISISKTNEEAVDLMCDFAMHNFNAMPIESKKWSKKAWELAEKIEDVDGLGRSKIIYAYQLWHEGDNDRAIKLSDENLAIVFSNGDYSSFSLAIMIKSMIAWSRGSTEKALKLIYNSISELDSKNQEIGYAWLYWVLAVFNFDLADLDESKKNYQKALEQIELFNKADLTAYSNIGLAAISRHNNDLDQALSYLKEAKTIAEKEKLNMQEARCFFEMGKIYEEQENYPEAENHLLKSYKMRSERNIRPAMVSSLLALCSIYLKQGIFDLPEKYLKHCLTICEEEKLPQKEAQCHLLLSDIYAANNKPEPALASYKRYHELSSDVAGQEASNKIKKLQTQFETEKSEKEAEIHRLKNVELKEANEEIQSKNQQLRETLDELAKTKISRKSILFSFGTLIVLVILTELLVDPFIEEIAYNNYISLSIKVGIALLLKPVESIYERVLIQRALKKR